MDARVGTLALRVHSELDGREAASRELADRFTRGVLEQVAGELERRVPGRLVFLRRLPVHWTLAEPVGEAADALAAEIGRAARELVAAVEATLGGDADPSPDAEAVAFPDEIGFLASAVRALVRDRMGWFHRAGGAGDPIRTLLAHPARGARVLERLAQRAELLEVIAALPREVIADLAIQIVPVARRAEPARREAARAWVATHPSYARLDPTGRALVAEIHAWLDAAPISRVDDPEAGVANDARSSESAPAAHPPAAAPPAVTPTVLSIDGPAPQPMREPGRVDIEHADSAYAGLFYLLAPLLELSLGEALWTACLPEGEVVARACAALVRDPDDAAIEVIAGGARRDLGVDADQVHEVAAAALAALAVALPRGGRAALPAGLVRFVEHATGRLLVVTAVDAPFVLFAWPASHPDDAMRGLAAVLARWPAGTPLHGTRAVIELDRSGRCQHTAALAPEPFLIAGASVAEVALVSLVAGTACQLFAARAGDTVVEVAAWVAQRLALRGRIVREPALVEIWLASDAVDLDLRRGALDRDPGYVGWLEATVRLRFEDPPLTAPS